MERGIFPNAALSNVVRQFRKNLTEWSNHLFCTEGIAKGSSTLVAGHVERQKNGVWPRFFNQGLTRQTRI